MNNNKLLILLGSAIIGYFLITNDKKTKKEKVKRDVVPDEQKKMNTDNTDVERQPNIGPVVNGQNEPTLTELGIPPTKVVEI